MKSNIHLLIFFISALSCLASLGQEIQIENLRTSLPTNSTEYNKVILNNEIEGVTVRQYSITGQVQKKEYQEEGQRNIYLFVKGNGKALANYKDYAIVPETILVPNAIKEISIKAAANDTLHFLKISSDLTEQDKLDLLAFPKENTQNVYFRKFTDCEAYTEPIKSPNTVSRTIFPNKYIPRVAMGTVQAPGPDKVDPHEHGMLEQLFLGLGGNNVTVYADQAQVNLPAYSLLHIPLGSSHSVKVSEDESMYYIWMDFFLDKKGEEWLKTHNTVKNP